MQEIVRTEVTGKYPKGAQIDIKRLQEDTAQGERGKTLVMGKLFLLPFML